MRANGTQIRDIAVRLDCSERQVNRLLKEARQTSGVFEEFARWTLVVGHEDGDPSEKIRWLLESQQPWDRSEARWAWLIHQLRPALNLEMLSVFVSEYRNVEMDTKKRWYSAIVDCALNFAPWESLANAEQFYWGVMRNIRRNKEENDIRAVSWIDIYLRRIWRSDNNLIDPVTVPDGFAWSESPLPDDDVNEIVAELFRLRIEDDASPLYDDGDPWPVTEVGPPAIDFDY